jgi:hypothetical protein
MLYGARRVPDKPSGLVDILDITWLPSACRINPQSSGDKESAEQIEGNGYGNNLQLYPVLLRRSL